jgi:signal transduction histidine kinase
MAGLETILSNGCNAVSARWGRVVVLNGSATENPLTWAGSSETNFDPDLLNIPEILNVVSSDKPVDLSSFPDNEAEKAVLLAIAVKNDELVEGLLMIIPGRSSGQEELARHLMPWIGKTLAGELALQKCRKQVESLTQANEEKEKFYSIVAHDLKSPFNGFLGLTYLLTEDLTSYSFEELHEITTTLRKSALTMYNLLMNLLEWNRIQRNVIAFDPQPLLLSDLVRSSVESFEEQAIVKKVILQNSVTELYAIMVDSHMVQVIFSQLIHNAIKYSRPEGRVLISAAEIDGKWVEVSIQDEGTGIPDEIRKKLFDVTELVKKPGTSGESGSGLGLLITKEMITRHGGVLWIESRVNAGTTVKFRLPLVDIE